MKQQNRTQGMKPSDFADRSDKEEDDHPSVSTDPEGSAQSRDIIEEGIARHETKAVGRTKLAVLLVMVVSATVVAASVFLYLSGTEQAQFEKQFIEDSHKVLESFGSSLGKSFGMLDELAVNLVAFSKATNQTWPFVTTPSFAARMAKLVPSTSAVNINILHIVTPEDREEWDTYSVENDQWVNEAMEVQETFDGYYGPIVYNGTKNVGVHSDFGAVPLNASRNVLPLWQNFPVIANTSWTYNVDWYTVSFSESYKQSIDEIRAVVSMPYMIPKPGDAVAEAETELWADFYKVFLTPDEEPKEPMSDLIYPIVDDELKGPSNKTVVGMLAASMYWREMIRDILPQGSDGIHIVFENTCTESFTYQINGPQVLYLGVGDQHDKSYDNLKIERHLNGIFEGHGSTYSGAPMDHEHCQFSLFVYPSGTMKDSFATKIPISFTFAVLATFAFTSAVFLTYDAMVEKRQKKVLNTAERSTAIVSSLFPSAVRDRLYPAPEVSQEGNTLAKLNGRLGKHTSPSASPNTGLVGIPIAEFYPDTTVLFADIVGFTAWSSSRQPTQVFHLLETLFGAFDVIARQRGVFKVETVGDCYVAVVGLPTPRSSHAVVMARFAHDIRDKIRELTVELEKSLGPGTVDLSLRIGLNSGPTTAGVLRGEKSRYQLFGDTVNTAARMESNGQTNRIQVSQKTASLIEQAGKGHWLTLREEKVDCKGKGLLTTYWCETKADTASSVNSDKPTDLESDEHVQVDCLLQRLVDWNVDMFTGLLKDIVIQRKNTGKKPDGALNSIASDPLSRPIDEVTEILTFPSVTDFSNCDSSEAYISPIVLDQLRSFVESISALYPGNPFHNFEHCSHVAMSTKKLLDRIAANEMEIWSTVRVSDRLTRFSIIFAALIHDAGHPGVSNAQLVNEQSDLAQTYKDRSVAEQNSIDAAWALLMDPKFDELRSCIFASETELKRFRQILVNVVMATDLFDKDLKAMRESRWERAFNLTNSSQSKPTNDHFNRQASIVLELVIQASDVSHTMQHFEVYKKWNTSLLQEMHSAFESGRAPKDPLDGWYEGELWFFDNYVIPLAEKLRACGVFGVSCDEFLNYATDNRMEWELKGRDIVSAFREGLLLNESGKYTEI